MRKFKVGYFGAIALALTLCFVVGHANAALIHYYKLDETVNPSFGTTAVDSAGSMNGTYGESVPGANLGPVVGAESAGTEYGTAATFDGVDDVVSFGSGLGQLTGTGTGFSIAAWIKPVQLDVVQYIISDSVWGSKPYDGWGLFIRGMKEGEVPSLANTLDFISPGASGPDASGYGRVTYEPFITEDDLGKWIHVAVTIFDPIGTPQPYVDPGGVRFYKNGLPVDAYDIDNEVPIERAGPIPVVASDDPFWLGCGFGYDDGPWQGGIDEVRIYDHVLSDIEVAVLAGATSIPGDADFDGDIDDADAAIVADNWLSGPDATWFMGDFNKDGYVNDIDATILAANWNPESQPQQSSVPEPGTAVLCLCAAAALCLIGWIKRFRRV